MLVPTFVQHLDADDQAEAERLASGILGIALVALGVVTVLALIAGTRDRPRTDVGRAERDHPGAAGGPLDLPALLLHSAGHVLRLGTVSTAVLYAKRQFAIAAIAPIANTVAVVIALSIFWVLHGSNGDLDLTLAEKLVLALGATFGVLGFVGVPAIALHRTGFRLRPRLMPRDERLQRPDAALGLGGAPARGDRHPARCHDRPGQPGRRRRGRVPVRVRPVPRSVRDPRPPGADRRSSPSSRSTRSGTTTPRSPRGCARRSTAWRCSCVPVSAAFVALAVPGDAGDHGRQPHAQRRSPRRRDRFTRDRVCSVQRLPALRPGRSTRVGDSRTPAIVALVTACLGAGFMVVVELREPAAAPGCSRSDSATAWRTCSARSPSASCCTGVSASRCSRPRCRSRWSRPSCSALPPGRSSTRVGTMGRVATIALLVGVGVVGAAIYVGSCASCGVRGCRRSGRPPRRPGRQREDRPTAADPRAAGSAPGSGPPARARTSSLIRLPAVWPFMRK